LLGHQLLMITGAVGRTSNPIKSIDNKKAELSQRWPRDAPCVRMPWKFLGVSDYAHSYFFRNFNGLLVQRFVVQCRRWINETPQIH